MFSIFKYQSTQANCKKYPNSVKNDTPRGSSFWKAPTYSKQFGPQQLGLQAKVSTFFSGPDNVDFENDLIFNPSFNIRREKGKTDKICRF